MTVTQLAEQMTEDELMLWSVEDVLREEDARHAAMAARVKAATNG